MILRWFPFKILSVSGDQRTQFWKGAIKESFQQNLVDHLFYPNDSTELDKKEDKPNNSTELDTKEDTPNDSTKLDKKEDKPNGSTELDKKEDKPNDSTELDKDYDSEDNDSNGPSSDRNKKEEQITGRITRLCV